jgi:hypothetical protein
MASDLREILEKKSRNRRPPTVARQDGTVVETPLDRASRDLAILNMRLHGLTFPEIAGKLPELGFRRVSASRVYAIVDKALRSCREQPARELRQLELLRLDQLQAAHYKAAMGGDGPAISRVLSIMDRRARYLGLDAGAESTASLDEARASLEKKLEQLSRGQAGADAKNKQLSCGSLRPMRAPWRGSVRANAPVFSRS